MKPDLNVPTEYVDGVWRYASHAEPSAVITYTEEPSPETGHVGWCWWTPGAMGDAPTYEAAKLLAENWVRVHLQRTDR